MTIKKAIILGALGSILVGLTAFALNKNYKLKIQTTYADEQETANGIWYFNNTLTNTTPNNKNTNEWELNLKETISTTTPNGNDMTTTSSLVEQHNLNFKTPDYNNNYNYTKINWQKTIQNNQIRTSNISYHYNNSNQGAYNYIYLTQPQYTWVQNSLRKLRIYEPISDQNLKTWFQTNANSTPLFNEIYEINYTDENNTEYKNLGFTQLPLQQETFMFYNNTETATNNRTYYFNNNTWANDTYKTIKITGGTDTTNPLLIQWLKQNATKITTTNLNMTTWQLKQTQETITAGYYRQYGAMIQSNGMLMSGIYLGYNESETALANTITIGNKNIYNNGTWLNDSQGNYNQYSKFIIVSVEQQDLKLIRWLFNNATQFKTITDLKNTQWQFITNPAVPNNSNWNINFTSNGQTYTNLILDNTNYRIQYKRYNGTDAFHAYDDIRDNAYETSYWTNNNYRKITITDGADTTNLYAISYFISNAQGTSFTPIPTGNNNYDIETGNFVSLQELILRILTLPFTFIAQAFDITLWPNTAWEFNLSNFFLALIGIATILFIIKLFTSGFSVIGNYTGHPIQTHEKNKNLRSKTKLNKAKTEKIKNKE